MDIDSIEALLAEAEVKLGDRETMAAGRLLLDAGQAWLELLEDDTQQEWKRLKEECMQEARSFFAMDFGRMETRFVIGRQRGVFLGQEVEVVAEVVYRIRPLVGRGGGEEGGSQADGAGGAGLVARCLYMPRSQKPPQVSVKKKIKSWRLADLGFACLL